MSQLRTEPNVKICCDAAVKHSAQLTAEDPVLEALELAERGMADAILLTGRRTGEPVDIGLVAAVKRAIRIPVWAGSGVNFENIETVLRRADGLIAGTILKEEARVENPVDPMLIRRLTQIRDRLFGPSR